MVPFAGYDMPVQYAAGVMKEHSQTRENAGLFDVSHMGQVIVRGPDYASAATALEALIPSIFWVWPRTASAMGFSPTQRAGSPMT